MKSLYLALALSFILTGHATAQTTSEKDNTLSTILSFGLGLSSENNIGHWGTIVTNDLKVGLNRSLALNPRLGFFETIAGSEDNSFKGFSSHSGLFMDLGISYFFIREKDYAFSLSAGSSYQMGNQTRTKGRSFQGNTLIDERFEHTRISRLGLYVDLEYIWNTEGKYIHSIALKSYSFDIYPEFLGLAYKIGFKL